MILYCRLVWFLYATLQRVWFVGDSGGGGGFRGLVEGRGFGGGGGGGGDFGGSVRGERLRVGRGLVVWAVAPSERVSRRRDRGGVAR